MRPFAPFRWLACIFALVATLGFAADATVIHFDIPADTAADAVKVFARQSGSEVIIRSDKDGLVKTNAVKGDLTVAAALDAMLKDTGLVADRHTKTGAFAIRSESEAESKNVAWALVETDARPSGKFETDSNGEKILKLDTFEVFGRKTLNMDIRRTQDDIQPYVVFDRGVLENSGASNVEEFLQKRLPMNAQKGTAIQSTTVSSASNVGTINLRGLGTNQTLILVDGRRIPAVADGGDLQQANISGIPFSAIERIEILPSTASAIYGGSATGGAVNIILKRNYSGFDLEVSYANTFKTDVGEFRTSVNGGLTLPDGKSRVMLTAAHSHQNSLLSRDRNFARRSVEMILKNNPTFSSLPFIFGPLANVWSNSVVGGVRQPLTLDSGGALNAPMTYLPLGYGGYSTDSGAALLANAGKISTGDPASILRQGRDTDAFGINVRREVTPAIEGIVDYYHDRSESAFSSPQSIAVTVPGSAPANPFQQDVRVNLPLPSLLLESSSLIKSDRARLGLTAKLPGRWMTSAEYGWARSISSAVARLNFGATAGGLPVLQAAAFQDPNSYPVDNIQSLMSVRTTTFGPATSILTNASLRIGGPLLEVPAGSVTASGLIERRDQKVNDIFQKRETPPAAATFTWYPSATQRVDSCYAELIAPLASSAHSLLWMKDAAVTASVRHDEYDTSSVATTFSVPSPGAQLPTPAWLRSRIRSTDFLAGLRFLIAPGLTLRGSHGTGFLPPRLDQLGSRTDVYPASAFDGVISDPRRGQGPLTGDPVTGNITLLSGGNPTLKPERSKSDSLGIIFEPSWVPGLRLTADYTIIRKTDEIGFINYDYVLSHESLLSSRVVRAANLPGDLAGWGGPVVSIDYSAINLFTTDARAIDLQIEYAIKDPRLGSISIYAVATDQTRLWRQTSATIPGVNTVGYFDGTLKWRGNIGFTWERGRWQGGWNMQYYGDYNIGFADPGSAYLNPDRAKNQGAEAVPTQTYHDVFVRYNFGAKSCMAILRNTSITLASQNIFDQSPPVLNVSAGGGSYSTYGDPRLRRFSLEVRKSFGN